MHRIEDFEVFQPAVFKLPEKRCAGCILLPENAPIFAQFHTSHDLSAEKNTCVTKQAPAMYRLKGNKYSHHYGAPSLGICLNAGVSGRPSG